MDRPVSAASSSGLSTTPTTTSTTTHKRTASSAKAAGIRPSVSSALIKLFLTNLRLLDLDLLRDWPGITTASLGQADARTRIRCVEWSLYQLFRLHDPSLTAEKLQPFFPPLEPLQSINLRAALYRCLNELKKNGVIGREAVLRKTMLDECSGDKFWEVCLAFSATVLRQVILRKSGRDGHAAKPVAQKLGLARNLAAGEKECLVPLAVAHKSSLNRVVAEKERTREGFRRLETTLGQKEVELAERRLAARQKLDKAGRSQREDSRLREVEHNVRKTWLGNDDLRDVLINGEPRGKSSDHILVEPTDVFLSSIDENTPPSARTEVGLEDIHAKARAQNQRMKRWQKLYDQLLASKPQPIQHSRTMTAAGKLQFDRHGDLNPKDSLVEAPARHHQKAMSVSRYDDILTAMREDLRRKHVTKRDTTSNRPVRPKLNTRQPSVSFDASARTNFPSRSRTHSDNQHQRSPSHLTPATPSLPFRPGGMARRVPSRSRSYQQPKVISQREPIPLKSEIFSPIKTSNSNRDSTGSLASLTGSLAISPLDEGQVLSITTPPNLHAAKLGSVLGSKHASQNSQTVNSGVDGAIDLDLDTDIRDLHQESGLPVLPGTSNSQSPVQVRDEISVSPASHAAPRPSLAERTRMSMAFSSSENIHENRTTPSPGNPTHTTPSIPETSSPASMHQSSPDSTTTLSLAERTRQSISLHQPSTKHTRTRSSLYPNNGNTPPEAQQTSLPGNATQTKKRNITPYDSLFTPDAAYDSVFKSRPRIALSPVLSPSRPEGSMQGDDEDGILGA